MILCVDNVLADPHAYRAAALQQPFGDVPVGEATFHGIAEPPDLRLANWLADRYQTLNPTLTFLRMSPLWQVEPNDIHTDAEMGDWTGILYLTPKPPAEDGTIFWQDETGHVAAGAMSGEAGRDRSQWKPWYRIRAQFNRLVLFPAPYFHSRALTSNYGDTAETARLIQVVFGRLRHEEMD